MKEALPGTAAVAALVVALAACTASRAPAPAIPTYTGPARPAGQVAIFDCGFGVTLRAVDGNRDYQGAPLACRYALLPGRHRFRVSFSSEKTGQAKPVSSPHDYLVRLRLEAGHRYTLNAFYKGSSTGERPWKVDLADSAERYPSTVTDIRPAP